jgi:hypothetical protein
MTKRYCLAQDLFVLASTAFENKDYKSAVSLFASACIASDINDFRAIPNVGLTVSELASDTVRYTVKAVSERVLASLEEEITSAGPLSVEELRAMVTKIKHHACSDCLEEEKPTDLMDDEDGEADLEMTDGDSDEDLDMSERCEVCKQDLSDCECEFEQEGEREVELSTGLVENVKNELLAMKVREHDWEIKKYIPLLLNIFPQLASESGRTNDIEIPILVNKILNRLRAIDYKTLVKLHTTLSPLLEA